jgi:hypothetical protein
MRASRPHVSGAAIGKGYNKIKDVFHVFDGFFHCHRKIVTWAVTGFHRLATADREPPQNHRLAECDGTVARWTVGERSTHVSLNVASNARQLRLWAKQAGII